MMKASKLRLRRVIVLAFLISSICSFKASAFDYPKDLPTIETLIDLHKRVKKDEEKALVRIGTSYGEQNLITKGSKLFNDARSTLDSKLNNIYSYVILATNLAATANSLYKVTEEYADFTSNTFKYVSKKPFVAWYYTNANVAIEKEIKHCVKLYGIFAASGANLWRAAMDEKINLIMTLQNTINRIRRIIGDANLYCSLMINTDWRPDYIWEILTSDVKDAIAERVINQWKK